MGIKTVRHPPYSPDLAPCDLWLFPKLRGCRYETIEEIKEVVTKVIDTLTQEDIHVALQELLKRNEPTAPLHKGKPPPPTSVLDMKLNNLMVRFQ